MRRGWADDLRRIREEVRERVREQQSKKSRDLEEEEDCVILDGDPNKAPEILNESVNESDELVVLAEKGQIACRDYPHARHLCVTFPFNTSPHEKYCDMCHCYVCDTRAPCIYWGTGKSSDDHCHSTDKEEIWRQLRQRSKEELAQLPVSGLLDTSLSNELPCHQALNCSQPLNVIEERVVDLDLMFLALDRSAVQGDRSTGVVKWFDRDKGYGFITPEDEGEDLFVHHSSIKSKGHRSLAEGEIVEFQIEIDNRGRPKASNVSSPGGSLVQGTSGRDNCCIDFSTRGGRGPGDRIYGGRASTSRRGEYGRNKDAGATGLGGSIFQGITRRDNLGNSDSDAAKCYKCGEVGHLARSCNSRGGSIFQGITRRDNFGNSDSDAANCYKCGEVGHLAGSCNSRGGDNGNNFRVRVDHGGWRIGYGSRGNASYRGGDYGRNRATGVSSPSGSFLQETTGDDNSNRNIDVPKCYNCGEIGHSTRNCDGGGSNGFSGSNHMARVDHGGGRASAYRRGDLGRNTSAGASSCDKSSGLGTTTAEQFHNRLLELEIFPCTKCWKMGHSSRNCDDGVGGNGFNTFGSYNNSDNRQRGGSVRGGSSALSNSRYNERNKAVSTRSPSGNLPRGNTRAGSHYGERGNSARDHHSTERGSPGCYICGKPGHRARDCNKERGEGGVLSCTCGEAGHLPDCPKKQDGGRGGTGVPCFTCREPGHLPMDCPKKHQIWRDLHYDL